MKDPLVYPPVSGNKMPTEYKLIKICHYLMEHYKNVDFRSQREKTSEILRYSFIHVSLMSR